MFILDSVALTAVSMVAGSLTCKNRRKKKQIFLIVDCFSQHPPMVRDPRTQAVVAPPVGYHARRERMV